MNTNNFNFAIISLPSGVEIIDKTTKTPYHALQGLELVKYIETERTLLFFESQERKARRTIEKRNKSISYKFKRLARLVVGLFV